MELNEKLIRLRKEKGITQEQLANALFVSRTAISKWESGRGYPSIDSLKTISEFFGLTIDELLSRDELLTIASQDVKQKENHFRDLTIGLSDISALMLLFLPLFRQGTNAVSLLTLTDLSPYLKIIYYIITSTVVLCGVLTLALQNCEKNFWLISKSKISLFLNLIGVIVFVVSLQPYAAVFLLAVLIMQTLR